PPVMVHRPLFDCAQSALSLLAAIGTASRGHARALGQQAPADPTRPASLDPARPETRRPLSWLCSRYALRYSLVSTNSSWPKTSAPERRPLAIPSIISISFPPASGSVSSRVSRPLRSTSI